MKRKGEMKREMRRLLKVLLLSFIFGIIIGTIFGAYLMSESKICENLKEDYNWYNSNWLIRVNNTAISDEECKFLTGHKDSVYESGYCYYGNSLK